MPARKLGSLSGKGTIRWAGGAVAVDYAFCGYSDGHRSYAEGKISSPDRLLRQAEGKPGALLEIEDGRQIEVAILPVNRQTNEAGIVVNSEIAEFR